MIFFEATHMWLDAIMRNCCMSLSCSIGDHRFIENRKRLKNSCGSCSPRKRKSRRRNIGESMNEIIFGRTNVDALSHEKFFSETTWMLEPETVEWNGRGERRRIPWKKETSLKSLLCYIYCIDNMNSSTQINVDLPDFHHASVCRQSTNTWMRKESRRARSRKKRISKSWRWWTTTVSSRSAFAYLSVLCADTPSKFLYVLLTE